MLNESLERAEPTVLFLHATGRNGRFTGVLSCHSTINEAAGDKGESRLSAVKIRILVDRTYSQSIRLNLSTTSTGLQCQLMHLFVCPMLMLLFR